MKWALLAFLSASLNFAAVDPLLDWPAWRGPTGDGIAASGQNPPTQWSETNNILWKAAIPGRGHGSPTIVGNHIYLATADQTRGSQSILCVDRLNGKILWQTEVHAANADPGKHANSSAASSTVASDGERLYINFLNNGAVHTTALNREGKIVWQEKICDYITHQGFASSPMIYQDLVLISADHKGGGIIAGLDRRTGKSVWTYPRPKLPNYTSPAIIKAAGKTQMVMAGCSVVTSLDPLTGKKIWEVPGSTEECVGSAVTDGMRVFFGGGWPKNHTAAMLADGSGTIAWQNGTRIYVPSMIAKDGHLFAVLDAGIAVCWKGETGEEVWKERLGGDFYASPVMVNDRIYATNLKGETYVFQATPTGFKLLAKNPLADETYATLAIAENRIYLRAAKKGETRQEFLYAIAEAAADRR